MNDESTRKPPRRPDREARRGHRPAAGPIQSPQNMMVSSMAEPERAPLTRADDETTDEA